MTTQTFTIRARFDGCPVILDTKRSWAHVGTAPVEFGTFAEAEAVYRRLLAIGTKATDILVIGA